MNNLFTTSAAAQPEDSSVLATLRQLVPHRRMQSLAEIKWLAELQANRLRELFEIDSPAFPQDIICDLPRVQVEFDADLPVSGSAHWNGSNWVIMLNALESHARQRFSLAHEFKHVLDHSAASNTIYMMTS